MNLAGIKDVLVVRGAQNTGKTTVLKKLYADFLALCGSSNCHSEPIRKDKNDIVARVLLPDGRVLGIASAGDNADTVLQGFMSFHDTGQGGFVDGACDIVAIALRTISKGRQFVKRYQPQATHAEILFDELRSAHGANWHLPFVPNTANLPVNARAQHTSSILSALHNIIGF